MPAIELKLLMQKVASGASLSEDEMVDAFETMMSGVASPVQMGAFLMALRVRGETIPEITGDYFYADWCRQWVRSFAYVGGDVTDEREWEELGGFGQVNSFGLDADGELLVTTWGGEVARLVAVRQS